MSDTRCAKPAAVVKALRRRDRVLLRKLLKQWGLPLRVRPLPKGPAWILGTDLRCESQQPLLVRLRRSERRRSWWPAKRRRHGVPRVYFGPSAFWQAACDELWGAGELDQLRRRLSGTLEFIYTPATYRVWGRLLAKEGRDVDAGMYLLFSGEYESSERYLVEKFIGCHRRAQPTQIISSFPAACRRRSVRSLFSKRVRSDLRRLRLPPWYLRESWLRE